MNNKWYKSLVVIGNKIGKKLGYPTLNLDKPNILKEKKKGVYLSKVLLKGKKYYGLLYLGPRLILGEKKTVLEIFLFDFDKEIYNLPISFCLISFIREVMNFSSIEEYKIQLKKDIKKAKNRLSKLA